MNKESYRKKCEALERTNSYMKEFIKQSICLGHDNNEQETESDTANTKWDFFRQNARESDKLEIMKAFAAGEEAEDRQQIREVLETMLTT